MEEDGDPSEGSAGATDRCEHDRQADQPNNQPHQLETIVCFECGIYAEDRDR